LQPIRKLFFLSLKQILCLRTISISRPTLAPSPGPPPPPAPQLTFSVLVNPENQSIISSMRVMASEIISTCTVVCPYLIRLSILEGSVPLPPVTLNTATQQQPHTSSSISSSNLSFSNDPLDDMLLLEKETLPSLSRLETPRTQQQQSSSSCISPVPVPAAATGVGGPRVSYPHYHSLESQSKSLLFVLIERILCDDEVVVIEHLGDTLKVLLDPDRIEKSDRERFISLFYDYYLPWILLPFTLSPHHEPDEPLNILSTLAQEDHHHHPHPGHGQSHDQSNGSMMRPPLTSSLTLRLQSASAMYTSRRLIYDILSFCLMNHTYRMKSFMMRSNLLSKFLRILTPSHPHHPSPHNSTTTRPHTSPRPLTSRSPKYYHMYSLKLMKCVISLKDDSLNRYIVKHNLFKPIFEFFSTLYAKDNILTSVLIDLLEFIRNERIQILIFYIVEKLKSYYSSCLSSSSSTTTTPSTELSTEPCQIYYTEFFEKFELTYSQLKEFEMDRERIERFDSSSQGAAGGGNSRKKRDHSGVCLLSPPLPSPPLRSHVLFSCCALSLISCPLLLLCLSQRSFGDVDLEDAYFEDDEEEEELPFSVGNGLKDQEEEDDDEEYGPSPCGGGSKRRAGGGGGYFQDLQSHLTRPTNGSGSGTAAPPSQSSLSMISDLYDDFEDELPAAAGGGGGGGGGGTAAAIGTGPGTGGASDHDLDSLPPLRPKYATDEDDDEYTHAFFRSSHQASKGTKSGMSSNGSHGSGPGGRGGGTSGGSPSSSSSTGSGISFSIMNKKQVWTPPLLPL
jgi:hypothetical protein